jgi:hypothetical protein
MMTVNSTDSPVVGLNFMDCLEYRYPEYLIRFYRGQRDHQRTPFASRQQAQQNAAGFHITRTWSSDVAVADVAIDVDNTGRLPLDHSGNPMPRPRPVSFRRHLAPAGPRPVLAGIPPSKSVWQWENENGTWESYDAGVQLLIETKFKAGNSPQRMMGGKVIISTDTFQYELDLSTEMQINLTTGTERRVRRTLLLHA